MRSATELLAVAAVTSVMLVAGLPVMLAMVSFAGMPLPIIRRPTSDGVMVPVTIGTVVLPLVTFPMAGKADMPATFTEYTTKSFAQSGAALALKPNFAGYMAGAVVPPPRLMLQSRWMPLAVSSSWSRK